MISTKIQSTGSYMLPRWQLLYSKVRKRKLYNKSVFPSTHLLHKLPVSKNSARKLVQHIFNNVTISQSKKIKLLPKDEKSLNPLKSLKRKHEFVKSEIPEKKLAKIDCSVGTNLSKLQKETKTFKSVSIFHDSFPQSRFLGLFAPHVTPHFETDVQRTESQSTTSTAETATTSKFVEAFKPVLSKLLKPVKSDECTDCPVPKRKGTKIHVTKHLRKSIDICYMILKKSKRNDLSYLLDRHCPLQDKKDLKDLRATNEIKDVLKLSSTPHTVFLFLRSIIRHKFPIEAFWGTKSNRLAFLKNLKMLLNCRRHDKILINNMIVGIAVEFIPWISGSQPMALETFCKFIKWLLLDYIFVIIRRFFYVTEHSNFRNRLFYFRKEIWANLVSRGTAILVEKKIWIPLQDQSSTLKKPQHTIRFCPKVSGLRPIMKKVKDCDNTSMKMHRYNDMIPPADILRILKYICKKYSKLVGCGTSSRDDMHVKWKAFWRICLNKCELTHSKLLKLYCVKVDVDRCFDTIPVDELLYLIQEILDRTARLDINNLSRHSRKYTRIADCADAIYATLCSSLKNVILDVMGEKYIKLKGIPQGWCLSSILCDIFYGNLETKELQNFMTKFHNDEGAISQSGSHPHLLMRYLDDFMFVTTCKSEALQFVRKMHDGFEKYGCKVNPKKTCMNFSVDDFAIKNGEHITVLTKNSPFQWFGFLFPTIVCTGVNMPSHYPTLEGMANEGGVSLDLSRYACLSTIRDAMTVNPSARDHILFSSLCRSMCLRVTAVCFDTQINSHRRVLINLYEVASLAVLQWLAQDLCRSPCKRISSSGEIVLSINRLAAVFVLSTIRKKLPGQKFPNKAMTLWIFFKAFRKKLMRYCNYNKTCRRLYAAIRKQERNLSLNKNWKYNKRLLRSAVAIFPKHLSNLDVNI